VDLQFLLLRTLVHSASAPAPTPHVQDHFIAVQGRRHCDVYICLLLKVSDTLLKTGLLID